MKKSKLEKVQRGRRIGTVNWPFAKKLKKPVKKKKVCKEEIAETQKAKWHPRHKWKKGYFECPACGGCEVKYCDRCGEEVIIP